MSLNAKPCTMNVKRGRKARASSESIHAQKTWLNMEVMQSEAEEQDSIPAVGKTPSTEPGLLDSLDMNLQPDEETEGEATKTEATQSEAVSGAKEVSDVKEEETKEPAQTESPRIPAPAPDSTVRHVQWSPESTQESGAVELRYFPVRPLLPLGILLLLVVVSSELVSMMRPSTAAEMPPVASDPFMPSTIKPAAVEKLVSLMQGVQRADLPRVIGYGVGRALPAVGVVAALAAAPAGVSLFTTAPQVVPAALELGVAHGGRIAAQRIAAVSIPVLAAGLRKRLATAAASGQLGVR